ncbi:alpha/beta fold hydrolase [Streptomyces chartreusis]|uniref:Alpha/beta hydrolase n=1 Tax=Streptomyces chartreusis TaxID=1969 RepID=A0A7H8T2Q5_STRCX|nr:alpha/beta hydrolase [Streptomyces chartreusis]QKZ17298.1 alpha/beta hydrolase [Streptomyces chartreusis]
MLAGFEKRRIDVGDVTINLRTGGDGPPLLLLHGYPQTHVMWHRIAPALAEHFTLVLPDIRGFGDSSKPAGDDTHLAYSKRALAADQVKVMEALGFSRFRVVGHDRGARVTHRMCLDHADRVEQAAVLDIVPTSSVYAMTDQAMATAYFHWFFLIQPGGLPEHLIGADPDRWLDHLAFGRGGPFDPEALAEYRRCFRDPATIHATCEEYRAAATVDLEHDAADADRKVDCPLLVLWGDRGFVGNTYDPVALWRKKAVDVRGEALPGGHFLAEEAPDETLKAVLSFLKPEA